VLAITLDMMLTIWASWSSSVAVLGLAATAALPIFMGIAILRYRLYDIDLLINRTLVYGGLSLGVVAVYVLVVGYFTDLLHVHNTVVPSLLVTALVALAFQPARQWLQQRVNRLMFGERDTPYQVLARLGERFAGAFEPSEVLPTLVRTVAESLKLPYVAITIEGQEQLDSGAAVGTPTEDVTSFPLVHQGERVGHLLVCPRRGESAITEADRHLMLHLAQRAGVAVHSVRLTRHLQRLSSDLQRSRERLVLAQEEERSRLRNDLHDGLAPRLAGLALSAGTIADLVRRDPELATRCAQELEGSIRETVGEIRRLVYNLRPPTLDDLGLLAAIEERAMQFGTTRPGNGGLRVRTQLPERLPSLPAAVEVAVYRIVQEALMNVERHAAARCCLIRLQVSDTLQLEITDDGRGVSEGYRPGIGLRSMRERAEELGGHFAIGPSERGGTRLWVSFPLAAGSLA
jgi:signal transduction histidine kinase